MYRPSLELFALKAENLFWPLISKYGYALQQTRFHQYSVQLIYHHTILQRSVIVENAIHGYDYGFTVFIEDVKTRRKEILLNMPNEKQDSECVFLERVVADFFSSIEVVSQLANGEWQPLSKIVLKY
jgi:hypothetical protein